VATILIIFVGINGPNLVHAVQIIKTDKSGGTNLKVGVQIICEQSEQNFFPLNCCTQNCHL